MKVIIDITDEQYEKVKRLCAFGLNGEAEEAILYGMNFTKNATNGDIIKEMFPNTESRKDEKTDVMLVKWTDGTSKCFKSDWWEAPYIEGDNK